MITSKKLVKIYRDQFGKEPYSDWLKSLKDPIVRARIRKRISRVEEGNLGNLEPVGGVKIMRHLRNYRDALIEDLKNPQESEAYLRIALEEYESDQNIESFLLALRNIADAQGGIGKLAEKTNLNRQNLYRILSKTGQPKFPTMLAILHGLGFALIPQKAIAA